MGAVAIFAAALGSMAKADRAHLESYDPELDEIVELSEELTRCGMYEEVLEEPVPESEI